MSAGKHAKSHTHKKKPRFLRYLLLVLVLLAVLVGSVSAKYILREVREHLFAAKEFYFTSNLLEVGGADYTLNSDATSVTFTLSNGADELRFTEDDIDYTYTVTADGGTHSTGEGTLVGGGLNKTSITLSDLEKGKTYTVTATGKAGYESTLKATFTLAEEGAKVYKHLDTTDPAYVLLTVWTENVSGPASVSFPDGLIPDTTDSVMANVTNFRGGTYEEETVETDNFGAYSSHVYRFFRSDSRSYSVDGVDNGFDVVVGDHVAASGTP